MICLFFFVIIILESNEAVTRSSDVSTFPTESTHSDINDLASPLEASHQGIIYSLIL